MEKRAAKEIPLLHIYVGLTQSERVTAIDEVCSSSFDRKRSIMELSLVNSCLLNL
jgi:hypothetical protein